jgi:hypothetical protein
VSDPVERFSLSPVKTRWYSDGEVQNKTYREEGKKGMIRYYIFPEELQSRDLGRYTGWGIEARTGDGQLCGRVEDVTEDRAFAELVAAALNREEAEPVHLRDILEDLLSDPEARAALMG